MKTLPMRLKLLPLLLLAVALDGRAGEIASVRSGPPGQETKITFQPTDEPVTRFEAWDVLEELQARTVWITEGHIGFTDLQHGQIVYEYKLPASSAPVRYFRRQTIASSWNEAFAANYSDHTRQGFYNLTVQKNTINENVCSGDYQQVATDTWMDVQGYNMYGPWGPIYTATTTTTGNTVTLSLSSPNVPIFTATTTRLSGRPGDSAQVTNDLAGCYIPFGYASEAAPAPYYWGSDWLYHASYLKPNGPFLSPPAELAVDRVMWQGPGGNLLAFTYSLVLSEEDTLSDVLARWSRSKAAGAFDTIPWQTQRRIMYGGAKVEDKSYWYGDMVFLYNETENLSSEGSAVCQRGQIRFVVPESLRIPGTGYRARIIETFYPNNPPYDAQIVAIHEVEMHAGQWESPVITAAARDNGFTEIQFFSMTAELLQPRKVLALPASVSTTCPWEYATSQPVISSAPQVIDTQGNARVQRSILTGSRTLQQINLADSWGTVTDFDSIKVSWAILPGATAAVRLWHWKNDGSTLGLWNEISPTADLVGYFGSSTDFVFAEALTGGKATLRFTINVGGQEVHDDLRIESEQTAAALAVDANRDGQIELPGDSPNDTTSRDKPFRFWINDDNDSGDTLGDDIPLPDGAANRNCDDTTVNGIRDLVDFFPVFLDLKQLLTVLPPGADGVSYTLKQDDAALGFVYTNYTRTQAFDYLRGDPANLATGFGPTLTQAAGEAIVTKIPSAGVDLFGLSPAFLAQVQNNGGIILIEASKTTTKPLILEVRKGVDVIVRLELALKIDAVETMYHYLNLRALAHGTAVDADKQGPGYNDPTTATAAPNDPFQGVANRKNLVLVHGYNWNGKEARGFGSEMFKRFYWAGSQANMYVVLWRGDDGQSNLLGLGNQTPDFHRNVGHAWQQAPHLRKFVAGLSGDTVIMAHSLGNMVTAVALTHEIDPDNPARLHSATQPANVVNYFALNAAIPLEALAVSDRTDDSKALMRHHYWDGYDERLWPSHWHELFPSTDGRSQLTWVDAFATLAVGTNFYSSTDKVLANPADDSTPLTDPAFHGGLHAWVAQEKYKGGNGPLARLFRSWTAGWTTSYNWYVPIVPTPSSDPKNRQRFPSEARDVPTGVPTAALPQTPFFLPFQASETDGFYPGYQGSRLMAPISDSGADDEARKLVTQAKCLAEGIPALCYPQGSNRSAKYNDLGGNFDINIPYSRTSGTGFKNGWPSSRSNQDWDHGDYIQIAYTFNFPLYETMVANGALK
ncbi:MAG: hypothetical protein HZA31_10840 [Opitutae bacterium]|nr:hypothetical protein [Opitutae bacterium]